MRACCACVTFQSLFDLWCHSPPGRPNLLRAPVVFIESPASVLTLEIEMQVAQRHSLSGDAFPTDGVVDYERSRASWCFKGRFVEILLH